jgi:hypothetical protein
MALWDGSTGLLIERVNQVGNPTSTGWQTLALSISRNLATAHTYVITVDFTFSQTAAITGTVPWLSAPLEWDATPVRQLQNNPGNYPAGSGGLTVPYIDIIATTDSVTPPGGGTVTQTGLDNALRDWLVTGSENQHQSDGLPYTTKLLLDAVADNIDQGNADIAAVKAVTDILGPVVPGWVTTLEDLATWLNDWNAGQYQALKDRLLGSSGGGGSAFYGAGGTQVAQGVEDVLGILAAPTQQQPFHWPVLTDPAWEAVDSTAFDRDLWWEVPAHLYLAHFDTWPTRDTQEVLAGNTWVRRLAWWASMKAANLGERRYVEFTDAQLADAGLFMDGLYLRGRPGTTGTVTAYLLHSV